MTDAPLSAVDLEEALRAVGTTMYHDKHPFNLRMHAGQLGREELRAWVQNRFYYQRSIPVKDAIILSKLPTREDRRAWLLRIIDHDGRQGDEGGLESWLRLGDSVDISRSLMWSDHAVLPAVRFAVDGYVSFCRERSWLEGAAASLTELFAPDLMARRVDDMIQHYPWIPTWGLDYFRNRLTQQQKDLDHLVPLVLRSARSAEQQEACIRALRFKCQVLWSLLDAVEAAFTPGNAR
jgi:pyrroloquinoline-quinone synthase